MNISLSSVKLALILVQIKETVAEERLWDTPI